ncbi:MAG: hypothetical protein IPN63_02940 [Gammaproteobacteria bacterium]|nr:hypothetical protein [Gammaproteobacteria bacterium]MBK9426397.1 hypothetical protein [Gammaproteobacteria bacterium]
MGKQKSPKEDRAVIIEQISKRPYGVKVRIHLQTAGSIGNIEEVCISLNTGAFVSIAPTRTAPWEGGKNSLLLSKVFQPLLQRKLLVAG